MYHFGASVSKTLWSKLILEYISLLFLCYFDDMKTIITLVGGHALQQNTNLVHAEINDIFKFIISVCFLIMYKCPTYVSHSYFERVLLKNKAIWPVFE